LAYIDYYGIGPESIELVNSEEFRTLITANPNLKVVAQRTNKVTGKETLDEISLPLPEGHTGYVGVKERDNNEEFMWVLYDDSHMVVDPSPAFIEILKLMDTFSVETLDSRLFIPEDDELDTYDEKLRHVEFDFTTGDYKL
jgi:hypothetical protein